MTAYTTRAERVLAIREGGWTDRMHTVLKLRSYRNDGHQWGVATLCDQFFPDASKDLLRACLYHDVPERWCGDSPYPAKKRYEPEIGRLLEEVEGRFAKLLHLDIELTEAEQWKLNFCDMLELGLWTREELALGNKLMRGTFKNVLTVLEGMAAGLSPENQDLLAELLEDRGSSEESTWISEMEQ